MMRATPVHHSERRPGRRELVELAALFTAVAVADAVSRAVVHGPGTAVTLAVSAVALLATAGLRLKSAFRRGRAGTPAPAAGADGPGSAGGPGGCAD
ncbi:GNAT family N-acetyltransferase, partial [Streptomyces sp. B1866]|nr:GNAT family N-acetyltransferase [Streptomyces sp. B1866]